MPSPRSRTTPSATASRSASGMMARWRFRARRSPIRSPTRSHWRRPRGATAPICAPRFGWRRSRTPTAGSAFRGRAASRCAAGWRSTAPGLAPARWPASRATTPSTIYPRKGEFLVFDPPDGAPLERILLPVPSEGTKGVLVFPTLDGKVVAGPTAVDQEDSDDWSVRPSAGDEILPKATAIYPPLAGAEPVAAYAGLRPAGRGVNYLIRPSGHCPGLVNVAAIRSTGLTASLAIAERVSAIVGELGVALGPPRALEPGSPPQAAGPLVAPNGPAPGGAGPARGGMNLLLGIDEGTSAVKAVLFDAQPEAGRRGEAGEGAHAPAPGLGGAGPRGGADGRHRGDRRGAAKRRRRRGHGPRPSGGVGARLGRRERSPADPDRDLAGQALPGGAGSARDRWTRRRGARAQWHAAGSLLLGGQAELAARARRGGWQGAGRGHPAAGHRGLVPLRSAGCRVRHRSGDGVADPARRS